MVVTAQDLQAAGIDIPILVGGAALTNKFTRTRIAPEYGGVVVYAKDAMNGLDLANQLITARDPRRRSSSALARADAALAALERRRRPAAPAPAPRRRASLARGRRLADPDAARPRAARARDVPLDEIWPYMNPQMLYGQHLGLHGQSRRCSPQGDAEGAGARRRRSSA